MPRLPTLKWPWVGRQWSATTTLYLFLLTCGGLIQWLCTLLVLPGHKFGPFVPPRGPQKMCERRYHAACLYGNVTRWLKRKEQSMNYCQRSLRVLILARVQICSMQEQSTLRHISQSVCCSPRHGTKLTKHGEMCNNYSLHNPQCDFIDWNSLQRWRFGATGRALVAAVQINNVF